MAAIKAKEATPPFTNAQNENIHIAEIFAIK